MKLYVGQMISKYIFFILGGIFAFAYCVPNVSMGIFLDAEFPYDISAHDQNIDTTDISQMIRDESVGVQGSTNTTLIRRLTDFFRLSGTQYDDPASISKATDYIKRILNILLGLVSFLSLVMIIFAFYLIFFSKGEEAVTKAKKILIGVGIALAIMGLSWFIASFFFDIYGTVTGM